MEEFKRSSDVVDQRPNVFSHRKGIERVHERIRADRIARETTDAREDGGLLRWGSSWKIAQEHSG